MQKKIVLLAVISALSAPTLALADTDNVGIYGVAHMSVDVVNTGGANGVRTNQVSSNASYIGFRGSEELNDGWTAQWQIESQVNMDNSSSSVGGQGSLLGTRNTFVSMFHAKYGIVALGRYNTPYKITTRYMDVFADTIADNRSLMGGATLNLANLTGTSAGASFDGNQGDVLAYVSPAIWDVTFAAAYVAGAEAAVNKTQVKGHAQSYAAIYQTSVFNINVGHEVHNLGSANTGTLAPIAGLDGLHESASKVGVSYVPFDGATLYGVYERTKDNLGAVLGLPARSNLLGHNAWYVAGKYISGSETFKAAYTHVGNLDKNGQGANTGARQWTVGVDHALSRRTALYALYTKLENDQSASFNIGNVNAASGYANASALGASPSAFSLGLKHKF